jgi:hypothetical protein
VSTNHVSTNNVSTNHVSTNNVSNNNVLTLTKGVCHPELAKDPHLPRSERSDAVCGLLTGSQDATSGVA